MTGTIESVAGLLTAMTPAMAVGIDEGHGGILPGGPGATTGATTSGGAIAGAIIESATRAGGHETIGGGTMTGAIDGPTTGGTFAGTVVIDLCGVLKFGIAGAKVVPIAGYNPGSM